MLTRQDIRRRSLRSWLFSRYLRWRFKPRMASDDFDPVRFRRWLDREMGSQRTAAGVTIKPVTVESGLGETRIAVPAEWSVPDETAGDRVILYFHGGGYLFGSPLSYRSFTSRLAQEAGMRVLAPDYRLAPEQPFPAAVDDALAAYRWLLEAEDVPPSRIVLAGDSAGAGLALALVHALKAEGDPLPAAIMTLSPYTDLATTGASLEENSGRCAMFTAESIRRAARTYLAGAEAELPLASPLYGDFQGFPPLLILLSQTEALRDDGLRVAEQANRAGVEVQLQVWRDQPHVWPIFYPLIPEASRSIRDLAAFARQYSRRDNAGD
ncbi:MAG: alpha/beta hydrolase [Pseudohongiellaceae bacterium]